MRGFRARLDYVLKHNTLVNKVFIFIASIIMKFIGLFLSMDEKLVLLSAHSRKYNDSPKTLYEYMIAHPERYGNYKFVWALEDPYNVSIPSNPKKIKADTFEYFKTALKAKYWITCVNIERGLNFKKKGCSYLNTWHGLSINYCGNAVPGRNDFDFSNIDFLCYESDYHKEIFIRDFLAREEAMIPTGLPRNDSLYYTTREEIDEIKQRLDLPLDKKIILYAPTWRDSTDKGVTYTLKPPITVKYWEDELQDDYIILFRTHAYTNKLLEIEFNYFMRDMTNYANINDLFKASDILISDYSSCIADFSILERPIICFGYDYEDYKKIRGLYIDMEKDMPSGVKRTEKEVIDHIKGMDFNKECKLTRDMIKNRLTYIGGHATEICLKKMFGT